ncbi:hypothetical protein SRHO_G00154920 [Serrasalmus rhombeus]
MSKRRSSEHMQKCGRLYEQVESKHRSKVKSCDRSAVCGAPEPRGKETVLPELPVTPGIVERPWDQRGRARCPPFPHRSNHLPAVIAGFHLRSRFLSALTAFIRA